MNAKMWISILVFAVSVMAVSSYNTCPSNYFSAAFTGTIEQTVDEPAFLKLDPELTFFKYVLNFRDDAIRHVFEDAINFFNNTYGLDFSASPPNENYQRSIEDAVMSPFIVLDHIEYFVTINNWIRTGNTRSNCYRIHDGGLEVSFLADRTLYGSYGGAEGKPISVGKSLFYGFYSIDVCEQSPVIIQYQSGTPFRPEPVDGTSIINCDIYNRVLGSGKAQGIFAIRPDPYQPEKFRVVMRNAFTFPA